MSRYETTALRTQWPLDFSHRDACNLIEIDLFFAAGHLYGVGWWNVTWDFTRVAPHMPLSWEQDARWTSASSWYKSIVGSKTEVCREAEGGIRFGSIKPFWWLLGWFGSSIRLIKVCLRVDPSELVAGYRLYSPLHESLQFEQLLSFLSFSFFSFCVVTCELSHS